MKEKAALGYNGCEYEVGTSREGAETLLWRFSLRISRKGETVLEYDSRAEYPTATVAENVGERHARTWINAYLRKYR